MAARVPVAAVDGRQPVDAALVSSRIPVCRSVADREDHERASCSYAIQTDLLEGRIDLAEAIARAERCASGSALPEDGPAARRKLGAYRAALAFGTGLEGDQMWEYEELSQLVDLAARSIPRDAVARLRAAGISAQPNGGDPALALERLRASDPLRRDVRAVFGDETADELERLLDPAELDDPRAVVVGSAVFIPGIRPDVAQLPGSARPRATRPSKHLEALTLEEYTEHVIADLARLELARLRYLASAGEATRLTGSVRSFLRSVQRFGAGDQQLSAATVEASADHAALLAHLNNLQLQLGVDPALLRIAAERVELASGTHDACQQIALRKRKYIYSGAGVVTGLIGAAGFVVATGATGTMAGGLTVAAAVEASVAAYLIVRTERTNADPEAAPADRRRTLLPERVEELFRDPERLTELSRGREGDGTGSWAETPTALDDGLDWAEGEGEGDEYEGEGEDEIQPRVNTIAPVLPPAPLDEAAELPPMLDPEVQREIGRLTLAEIRARLDEFLALEAPRATPQPEEATPMERKAVALLIEEARAALRLWKDERELSHGFGEFFVQAELEEIPESRRNDVFAGAANRYRNDRAVFGTSTDLDDLRRKIAARLVTHCRAGNTPGDLVLTACSDPSALAVIVVAAIRDTGVELPERAVLGVQSIGEKLDAVLFFPEEREVLSLVRGERVKGVVGPIHYPATFYYSYLVGHGIHPDIEPEQHLLLAMPDEGVEQTQPACAEPQRRSLLTRIADWVGAKLGIRSGPRRASPCGSFPVGPTGSGAGGSEGSEEGKAGAEGQQGGGGAGTGEAGEAEPESGRRVSVSVRLPQPSIPRGGSGQPGGGSSSGGSGQSGGSSGGSGGGQSGAGQAGAGAAGSQSGSSGGAGEAGAGGAAGSGETGTSGAGGTEAGAAEGEGSGSGSTGEDGRSGTSAEAGGSEGHARPGTRPGEAVYDVEGAAESGEGGGVSSGATGGDGSGTGRGPPLDGTYTKPILDLAGIAAEAVELARSGDRLPALRMEPWRLREDFGFSEAPSARVLFAANERALSRFAEHDRFITLSPSEDEEQRRMLEADSHPIYPATTSCAAQNLPPRRIFRRASDAAPGFRYVFCDQDESMVIFRDRSDARSYAQLRAPDRPLFLARLASETLEKVERGEDVKKIQSFLDDPNVLRDFTADEIESMVKTMSALRIFQHTLESALVQSMDELEESSVRSFYYELHRQVFQGPFFSSLAEETFRLNRRLASDPLQSLAWANSLEPEARQGFFRLYSALGAAMEWPERWELLNRRYSASLRQEAREPRDETRSLDFLQIMSDPSRVKIDWSAEIRSGRPSIRDRRLQAGREPAPDERPDATDSDLKEKHDETEKKRGGTRGMGLSGEGRSIGPERGNRPLQMINIRVLPEDGDPDRHRLPTDNRVRPGGTLGQKKRTDESASRQEPVLWITPQTFVDAILSGWDQQETTPADAGRIPPLLRFTPRLRQIFLTQLHKDEVYDTRLLTAMRVFTAGEWLRYQEARTGMGGAQVRVRALDTGLFSAKYSQNAPINDQDQIRGPNFFTERGAVVPADLFDAVRGAYTRSLRGIFDLASERNLGQTLEIGAIPAPTDVAAQEARASLIRTLELVRTERAAEPQRP